MAVAASKLAADLIINSVSDVLGAEVVGLDVS